MMKSTMRFALAAVLAAPDVWGQIAFVRPADDSPVTGTLDVGVAAPGDFLDTKLRVRNIGSSAVDLNVLLIRGAGFNLEGNPALPFLMATGSNADFRVRFRPTGPGSYSATLEARTLQGQPISVLVRGSAPAGLTLLRDGVAVNNQKPIEFGIVAVGQQARIGLLLRNESAQDLPVRQLSASGAGLSLSPSPAPSFLRAGEEAPFELRYAPERPGAVAGTLRLDERTFQVVAVAREPAVPDAWIELDPGAARSGRQSSLRIKLAAPAPAAVTGTLRLEFAPAVNAGAAGDAAIQFLSNSSRSIAVQVAAGETVATVSGKPEVVFQTGTTAGTAVFRLTLGAQERETSVVLAPEAPMIDTVEMRPGQGTVEVTVIGFDNHRSAGNIVFTFTDQAGQELPTLSAEAGPAFVEHFRTSPLGGLFRLTARFPVNGDASKLARVAVRLANAVGATAGRSQ